MQHITNGSKEFIIVADNHDGSKDDELYVGDPVPTRVCSVEDLKDLKIFGVYLRSQCEALPPGFLPYNYKATKASGLKQFRFWEL